MHTRTELLNYLAFKYHLESYLEVGVQNKRSNFEKIICKNKWGVDPDPGAEVIQMTSDNFFSVYTRGFPGPDKAEDQYFLKFDLVFIDGLHHAEQVKKDFDNALACLNAGGFIVLHDCLPVEEIHAKVPRESKVWNGDTYRFCFHFLFNYSGLKMYIVDIDQGCAVSHKSHPLSIPIELALDMQEHKMEDIDWQFYLDNRVRLPIYDPEHFKTMV
jgi:hypothetical protein